MTTTIGAPKTLSVTHPNLLAEWDYEKNAPLSPDDVTYGSKKKVFWICNKGHRWETMVYKRASCGHGCPICAGREVLADYNDLAKVMPEIAKEWDYELNGSLTPHDVTKSSGKKVWWRCSKGHKWQTSVAIRTRGSGCPYCAGKKVVPGENDLASQFPQIAVEWNYEKNIPLTPKDITTGSGKKVWWTGQCGHVWQTSVNNRVRGHGCQICAGKKVIEGVNDLAFINPTLAQEWHPSKNAGLLPSQITSGANRKVWWKCSKCGNEWQATVATRKKGIGCAVCSGELQTSFPEQAMFYYLSLEFDTASRYNDGRYELDVYLISRNVGIEYDGEYYHKSNKAKMREERKNKHFQEKNVRLIRVKESSENAIENDVVFYKVDPVYRQLPWAIKSVFQLIDASVSVPDINLDRDQGKINEQYILIEKANSFLTVHPELASEWDYEKNIINPSKISFSSGKRVWWKCSVCNNEWITSIAHRSRGGGCPECAKKKSANSRAQTLLKRYGSLQVNYPSIADEWHPTRNGELQPSGIIASSKRKVWWKCQSCGNEWNAVIYSRIQGNGCPKCGRQKSSDSRNKTELSKKGSLLDKRPDLAKEWHPMKNNGIQPSDVTSGSNKKVWWIGQCGHEWQASVKDRVHGRGCNVCAKRIRAENRKKTIAEKQGSLQDLFPDIVTEWSFSLNGSLMPSDVSPHSTKKVWWECARSHTYQSRIADRVKDCACPYCSNHKAWPGDNDLLSQNPQLASEWNYEKNSLKPSEVLPKSNIKVWWKCPQGHEWQAAIYSRSAGSGCPQCYKEKRRRATH